MDARLTALVGRMEALESGLAREVLKNTQLSERVSVLEEQLQRARRIPAASREATKSPPPTAFFTAQKLRPPHLNTTAWPARDLSHLHRLSVLHALLQ